jgi:hypothetical protein
MYESIINNTNPNFRTQDRTQAIYKGITLSLVKDHYIYEVYYQSHYLGYFHYSRLNEAIKSIEQTGFYDGYNYAMRLQELGILQ